MNQLTKEAITIYGCYGIISVMGLFFITGSIISLAKPEWIKSLVQNSSQGEEMFKSIVYSGAFAFLLVAIVLYCIINAILKAETVRSKPEEISVCRDLSVTGNGHDVSKQLIFNEDRAKVFVKYSNKKMIIQREEKEGKISYKVIQYDDKTSDEDIRAALNLSDNKHNYHCMAVNYSKHETALQGARVDDVISETTQLTQ